MRMNNCEKVITREKREQVGRREKRGGVVIGQKKWGTKKEKRGVRRDWKANEKEGRRKKQMGEKREKDWILGEDYSLNRNDPANEQHLTHPKPCLKPYPISTRPTEN